MGHSGARGPRARHDDVIVERLDRELLVYDRRTDEVHQLQRLAAVVFELADGKRDLAEIATQASGLLGEPISRASAEEAQDQLARCDLIEQADGFSRRAAVRKLALAGAGAVVAVPLIKSIAVPTPAGAQSGCTPEGQPCDPNADACCPGSGCQCNGNNCVCSSL